MKRLFLASEAKHPQTFKDIENFIGGFKGKKIAYIPTAANGEELYGTWKSGDTWKTYSSTSADVEALVLEEFIKGDIAAFLKSKDVVFVAGGMSGYLAYWFRRHKLDKLLPELLENGLIYVGSSAGSMVCAKTSDIGEAYLGEPEYGAAVIPGLGLIEFDFYPHFENEMLDEIKKVWKGGDLYLVKNGEALTIEGDEIKFLGEKRILRKGKLI